MNTAPEFMHEIRQGNEDSFTMAVDCYYCCLYYYADKFNMATEELPIKW